MDRLNVDYSDDHFKYNFRVPCDNLDWFQITGYLNIQNKDYEAIHLYYNGKKVLFYSYKIKNNEKINTNYNEQEREIVVFRFINSLIEKLGYNWFTVDILEKIDVKVDYLKRKYKLNNLKNKKQNYIFEEYEDNEYNNNYNIISHNTKIGTISTIDKNIKLCLEHNIDIINLINKLEKELKYNKKLSKKLK